MAEAKENLFSEFPPVSAQEWTDKITADLKGVPFEKKMIWKGEILWEKNNYNCKYTAWGSWKSPSNPYLKYTWEQMSGLCVRILM